MAACLCAALLVPATASATYLTYTQAKNLARRGQAQLCAREPACNDWQVRTCTRVKNDKFRCGVVETYGVQPNLRRCKFNAVVELFPRSFRIRDGYNRCYNRHGELVAEGPATEVRPVP